MLIDQYDRFIVELMNKGEKMKEWKVGGFAVTT